ncbi:MAG: serine hydrolase [bacterium]
MKWATVLALPVSVLAGQPGAAAEFHVHPRPVRAVEMHATALAPSDDGFDLHSLRLLTRELLRDAHKDLKAIVLVRNGRTAYEAYFNGHSSRSLHDVRSVTKSITAILTGMIIADGLIYDVRAPLIATLSHDDLIGSSSDARRLITLEDLLTMRSGLAANDDSTDSPGNESHLPAAGGWARFGVTLPMASTPGTNWSYASVNYALLGAALEQATGHPLDVYAQSRLFDPLGIRAVSWLRSRDNHTVAQGNLSLRARDMTRIGELLLTEGRWRGRTLVPRAWLNAMTRPRVAIPWPGYDGYGYGWYSYRLTIGARYFDCVLASGNGGNKIYVIPAERIVVAIQSAAYDHRYGHDRSLAILRRLLEARHHSD